MIVVRLDSALKAVFFERGCGIPPLANHSSRVDLAGLRRRVASQQGKCGRNACLLPGIAARASQ
jgi:hypothetical protein